MPRGVMQPAFSAGELTPSLRARVDLARYHTGLALCRNFIVQVHGGVTARPGWRFVSEVKDSSRKVRLIPFVFNQEQTYVLEFGHLYMRVYRNGGQVVYPQGDPNEGQPVEIETPYTEEDLPGLRYVQSADILTIVHQNHAPRELRRTSHYDWSLQEISFVPQTPAPTNLHEVHVDNPDGDADHKAKDWQYVVTAVNAETGEESVGSDVLTVHGYLSRNDTIRIGWDPVDGAGSYNVYRGLNGVCGYVGSVEGQTEFLDENFLAVYSDNPPSADNPFDGAGKYPALVSYHQQRMVFARSNEQPQTIWFSQPGAFHNFAKSRNPQDDDAIEVTLASRQVNEIRGLVPLRILLVLTSGAEWTLRGDGDLISPATLSARVEGYDGAADLDPLVIGHRALFVQERGTKVRDIGYSYESDGYPAQDLSVLSEHLVRGHRIVDWTWAPAPHSCVWMVRDDGILLGLSYLREHEVYGWHWHDTEGAFESVCSVPEGSVDGVYAVVARTVGGETRRYVERLETEPPADAADAFHVDSGLSYDGRNTSSTTMKLHSTEGWAAGQVMDCIASQGYFTDEHVGGQVVFSGVSPIVRATILERVSDRTVKVRVERDVPEALRDAPTTEWEDARKRFGGLDHLEGKTVAILADGNVHEERIVESGRVVLDYPASRVHIGLPYLPQIMTLALAPGDAPVRERRKLVSSVSLLVERARGVWVGESEDRLREALPPGRETYDEPLRLEEDVIRVRIGATWNTGGQVIVAQRDPLPLTVLAVIPEVTVGD